MATDFDLPGASDPEASQGVVWDSTVGNAGQAIDIGQIELGQELTLVGSERFPSRFVVKYWATNATQEEFAGQVTAQVRFYRNDGPVVPSGQGAPGTLFYESSPFSISPTNQGMIDIEEFALSAVLPLQAPLPDTFTWTVQFSGLGSNDAAGLTMEGIPTVGQATDGCGVVCFARDANVPVKSWPSTSGGNNPPASVSSPSRPSCPSRPSRRPSSRAPRTLLASSIPATACQPAAVRTRPRAK